MLSPEQWEMRLVLHYLKSDGPSGGAAMSYLDATPAEIATASGIEGLGDEDAQRGFLAHFNRWDISDWLSGSRVPSRRDDSIPGYFRFLVLTALVSATETGAGETHNFRIRLGELLGVDSPFNSVSGVNALWRALAGWCERKRAAGEPYRRIELPSPGNANLIGIAVRIAFPSWQDRSALTQILRAVSPDVRRSPDRLAQELTRSRYAHELPQAVASALHDFNAAVRLRRRMLVGHRFWRLVQSIDSRLSGEEERGSRVRWRLEVRFEGYELDLARLKLFRGRGVMDFVSSWEGALQELEAMPRETLPKGLADALDHGVFLLSEAPGMTWVLDEESPSEDTVALLLARQGSIATKWPLRTVWRPLEGPWLASGRLDGSALSGLRRSLGLAPVGEARLVDLTFENGVKTDHSTWLGRPGFLPQIFASSTSTLFVQPVEGAEGVLSIAGTAPSWDLVTEAPLSGRWRVRAVESGSETEKVICFEPTARARWEFRSPDDRFEPEHDVSTVGVSPWKPCSPQFGLPSIRPELDNALEAIYAGPAKGWSEADLIRLLLPVMPHKHFVWDFLRGLAEAAWLDPFVLKSWRARLWRLRPPHLREIAPKSVVVAGALGAAARRRLGDVARATGGELTFLPGISEWAISLPLIEGVSAADLARELQWPITDPERPRLDAAPNCWPAEPRSGQGRELAGVWSFESGLFVPPDDRATTNLVRLERLVRARGDDRDIYRINGRGETLLASSRTSAILEAYRRSTRLLFDWQDGKFRRLARSGHLPLEIARALVAHASQASGPVLQSDGSWTYAYPADAEAATWVARILGSAVSVKGGGHPLDFLDLIVARRRNGRRLVWGERLQSDFLS
ncbi:hypothetical protein EN932_04140 [Mesorhizobium sp. M7A.F.Ca.US.002.01.1.1]|uniref:hypothetical protein n=1 Tax=Mesorhizobium sp. M7A.F.Ca.US.002.01.1.1 TaxID=2496700 RepID=UPI000FD1CE94|nr:hypothetical protein [Mesorhizobium sp. M7A.F.Ca.US.002.01.1.1]RVA14633.1 hypothetical protein EN932_04140 [Mesorhizobium sp. M7A.F.Ca.US.002.01.1.1]